MRRWVANEIGFDVERRESVCAKGWGVKGRNNLITL